MTPCQSVNNNSTSSSWSSTTPQSYALAHDSSLRIIVANEFRWSRQINNTGSLASTLAGLGWTSRGVTQSPRIIQLAPSIEGWSWLQCPFPLSRRLYTKSLSGGDRVRWLGSPHLLCWGCITITSTTTTAKVIKRNPPRNNKEIKRAVCYYSIEQCGAPPPSSMARGTICL